MANLRINICACLLMATSALAQVDRKADATTPCHWMPWSLEEIADVRTSEGDDARSKTGFLEGKAKSSNVLKKLKGSTITIVFKKPKLIGTLAFVQTPNTDWSQAKEILISVDGEDAARAHLSLLPPQMGKSTRGKIQCVAFNRTVSELTLKVESTYGETKGQMGGFSGIGEAIFTAAGWPLSTEPLLPSQHTLKLVVDSPVDTEASVEGRIDSIRFIGEKLNVHSGQHEYSIDLDKMQPAVPYGFEFRPHNLEKIEVSDAKGDATLKIISAKGVPESTGKDEWQPLPALNFPVKEINGQKWTEGHSYQTTGRFGNTAYNGLLTELVGDSRFRAYTANGTTLNRRQDFDLSIEGLDAGGPGSDDKAWKLKLKQRNPVQEKIQANWTGMVIDKILDDGGKVEFNCGLLVPGFLVDSNRAIGLSSRGSGRLPIRSGAPDEEEGRFRDNGGKSREGQPKIGPSAVLTSKGILSSPQEIKDLSEPWIVAIWGISDGKPTFWGDLAVGVLITGDTKQPIKWDANGLQLPPGKWGISTAFHGLLNNNWKADDVTRRAQLLTRLLRTYPTNCREYYRVEADKVLVRNEFTYDRWGAKEWQAADYAPIPPIFSWARDSIQWTGIPAGQYQGVQTPVGPYRWENGAVLQYALSRISADYAAFPRRAEYESDYQAMEKELTDKMKDPPYTAQTLHPWKIAYYRGWSQALLGASFWKPEVRQAIYNVARPSIEKMYAPSAWYLRKEVFTGTPYYLYGWPDMSSRPLMFGDPNSNVGQGAYSLYLYAKYSGDWATVKRLWPRVIDTVRFFEVFNDWAVPETTAREAIKYGAIDMDSIAYGGVAAIERMAEVLGDTQNADRMAYLRAKISAATALRFNMPRYYDPAKKFPEFYGVGFSEEGAGIEKAGPQKPSGLDHIAMVLSWTGEMPEMFGLYLQTLGPEFMTDFQKSLMDQYFSDWRQMPKNPFRAATHIALRAWIPQWPQADLKNDVSQWLAHMKSQTPPASTAGMFGIYTGRDAGVYLVNWEPAELAGSSYNSTTQTLKVELKSAQPFSVDLHSRKNIRSVRLNGKELTSDKTTRKADLWSLALSQGGTLEVKFDK